MIIDSLYDPVTNTFCHVVVDPVTRRCAIIDSVRDYDPKSGRTRTIHADGVIAAVAARAATVDWILETHVHADHLSAAPYLQEKLGGRIGIGAGVPGVQKVFSEIFNTGPEFATDGRQFDTLFTDGETFALGALTVTVLHTPGHTPACVSYLVDDGREQALFVGDVIFMPDTGTARCDFPGGDPVVLYRTIRRLLDLPAATRLYFCHDYPPAGRAVSASCTIAEERTANIHVRDGIDEASFVAQRRARDATLEMPVLILPSVQVNMRAGHLPPAEDNGKRYLKIPLDSL